MDRLLKLALAGTARVGDSLPPATMPADALLLPEGEMSAERRVLLMAGARAAYRRAGVSPRAVPAPSAAPDDAAPPCSATAGQLIARLLAGDQSELLPEALERLRQAGLRLPHALLPAALEAGARKADLRPALLATIGERGRWLASHHQPWRWATARPVAGEGGVPSDAEARWREGLPPERLALLRLVRAHDPALARHWLAAVWKGERAEFRAEAIGALGTALSQDDEPFLEAALDDRSQPVRAEAAKLLARLAGSALATRLRERADAYLAFAPGLLAGGWRAAAKALVRGASGGKLTVTPPERYDKAWARDGIAEKPPPGTGERAWWLQQSLGLVPPSRWTERFAVDPATLIAAAEGSDWGDPLLAGWEQATLAHRDPVWAAALWRHWVEKELGREQLYAVGSRLGALIGVMDQAEAESLLVGVPGDLDYRWGATLKQLPRPWGATFGRAMLERLRHQLPRLGGQGSITHSADFWLNYLNEIACAVPPATFPQALALRDQLLSETGREIGEWRKNQIDDFGELIRTRQHLMEEIPV